MPTKISVDFAAYKNKTVLITGHTGFKGAWLTSWLKQLGAKLVGIALDSPTEPSPFRIQLGYFQVIADPVSTCVHEIFELDPAQIPRLVTKL